MSDGSKNVKPVVIRLWDGGLPGDGERYRYLLVVKPSGATSLDGMHDTPQEVAKAKELFESIACIAPPEGSRYYMLTLEAVPHYRVKVDRRAIKTLNENYAAPRAEPRREE